MGETAFGNEPEKNYKCKRANVIDIAIFKTEEGEEEKAQEEREETEKTI